MGASSSSTYSQELKNPTRTLRTALTLNPSSNTFVFVQDMRKGVGEEQLLKTRVIYTGQISRINSDKVDLKGRMIEGNELYRLEVLEMRFEVEWGNEWYQCKKGKLVREDIHQQKQMKEKEKKKEKQLAIKKSPSNISHLSYCQLSQTQTSQSQLLSKSIPSAPLHLPNLPTLLTPPPTSLPRGYSQSAPLSPAPLSPSEHSSIDTDSGNTIQPQPITSTTDKNKSISTANSLTNKSNSSLSSSLTGTSKSTSSPSLLPSPVDLPRTFSSPVTIPRRLTILSNGLHHSSLQKSSSLEEMYDLLQRDTPEWYGTFSISASIIQVEMLSSEVKIQHYRPKFEYLWAQVQDECPIIMALSNVYHDSLPYELYIPKSAKSSSIQTRIGREGGIVSVM